MWKQELKIQMKILTLSVLIISSLFRAFLIISKLEKNRCGFNYCETHLITIFSAIGIITKKAIYESDAVVSEEQREIIRGTKANEQNTFTVARVSCISSPPWHMEEDHTRGTKVVAARENMKISRNIHRTCNRICLGRGRKYTWIE
ncbi:513_t:CDS:2 [Acaulospora morrowiae]|uniref:513_t:CDS:1 n=1 Tax=Acaulospora morrowiae TaxID=94023 RepID=A0A9N8Z3V8_9GLOM|nr:513_t:CDS:2 [Acaulospora morrowiae]